MSKGGYFPAGCSLLMPGSYNMTYISASPGFLLIKIIFETITNTKNSVNTYHNNHIVLIMVVQILYYVWKTMIFCSVISPI